MISETPHSGADRADALHAILCQATALPPVASLAEWRARDRAAATRARTAIEHAVLGGFAADRVGYAFASGYQAALRALDPSLIGIASLCASEAGGAHPRAIQSTLRRSDGAWLLDGSKRWATLAPAADVLLVVASTGAVDGRNRLRVVRVARLREGVTVEAMPAVPFAPEIPHGALTLAGVRVTDVEILDGDGYDRYLKPFRTLEDVHVHAAVLAYLVRVARQQGWPREVTEELVALLTALHALASADPAAPEAHVALGGVLHLSRVLLDRVGGLWHPADAVGRERWLRDTALFGVAERARTARVAAAWNRLDQDAAAPASGPRSA